MSSNNRRERELARQKRERQMARASASQKTNNLLIALVAVLVVVFGGWFLLGGKSNDSAAAASSSPAVSSPAASSPAASNSASSDCSAAPAANGSPKQFTAPAGGAVSGKWDWKLTTNCGDIVVQLDADKAPKTVGSMKFLTTQKWFDGVPCHRLTTAGLYVLQCGDPTGTGTGGPGYSIPDENLPAQAENNYPAGTIAMANSGPNTGGSQFFIVYRDTTLGPNYTIFGKVISGLDIVNKIAAAGDSTGAGDGAPAIPIGILNATITKEAS